MRFSLFTGAILTVFGGISFYLMKDTGLMGDEWAYVQASKALAAFLKGSIGFDEFQHLFVGKGWFMPGMTVLLAPVSLVIAEDKMGVGLYRLWMVFCNIALMQLIVLEMARYFQSKRIASLFLSLLLVPYFLVYLSALWADLISVLLLILVGIKFVKIKGNERVGYAVCLGICLGMLVYLRSTYLAAVPILFFVCLLGNSSDDFFRKGCLGLVAATTAFVMILPWSTWATKVTGIDTTTVTSLPLSQIISFGNRPYWLELQKLGGHGNKFYSIDIAVRAKAKESAISVAAQYKLELDQALARRTPQESYSVSVKRNIRHYLSKPSGFLQMFTNKSCEQMGALCKFESKTGYALMAFNQFITWVSLGMALLLLAIPFKREADSLLNVFFKGFGFLYLVPPFIATTHARYVIQVFPLLAVAIAILLVKRNALRSIIGFSFQSLSGVTIALGQVLAMLSLMAFGWMIFIV